MSFTKQIKRVSELLFLLSVIFNCVMFTACQIKQDGVQDSVDETLKQCRQLLDTDDFIGANKCFGIALLEHPASAREIDAVGDKELLAKCVELSNRKNYQQAIICLEGMTVRIPDKSVVFSYLADAYQKYYKQENNKADDSLIRAESAIKRAIELRPESAVAHDLYGIILEQKEDLQKALTEHREAVRLAPNDDLYLVTLALVQEKLNDSTGALESYKSALKINPDDVTTLYFLSVLYEKTGNLDAAIETIERQGKIEPLNEETLRRLKELKERREGERSKSKPLTKSKTAGNL